MKRERERETYDNKRKQEMARRGKCLQIHKDTDEGDALSIACSIELLLSYEHRGLVILQLQNQSFVGPVQF